MKYTYKKCCEAAEEASSRCRYYIFKCNRRNGYIALDIYGKVTEQYITYEFCGNAKEIYTYISGAINLGLKIYQV